jgi:hypothetical protein
MDIPLEIGGLTSPSISKAEGSFPFEGVALSTGILALSEVRGEESALATAFLRAVKWDVSRKRFEVSARTPRHSANATLTDVSPSLEIVERGAKRY